MALDGDHRSVLVPIGLVMIQPDFGTAMVLSLIVITLLAVAGVSLRHLLVLALLAVTLVVAVVNVGLLQQYQVDRLTSAVSPNQDSRNTTYNTDQSKNAIGNGGVAGLARSSGTAPRRPAGSSPSSTRTSSSQLSARSSVSSGAAEAAFRAVRHRRLADVATALFARDFFPAHSCASECWRCSHSRSS